MDDNRHTPPEELFCRNCRGRAKNAPGRPPIGWYQMTVAVPEYMESVKDRDNLKGWRTVESEVFAVVDLEAS